MEEKVASQPRRVIITINRFAGCENAPSSRFNRLCRGQNSRRDGEAARSHRPANFARATSRTGWHTWPNKRITVVRTRVYKYQSNLGVEFRQPSPTTPPPPPRPPSPDRWRARREYGSGPLFAKSVYYVTYLTRVLCPVVLSFTRRRRRRREVTKTTSGVMLSSKSGSLEETKNTLAFWTCNTVRIFGPRQNLSVINCNIFRG